jgi:hypothetical protein
MKKKTNRGGKRIGSGRKKKAPTTTVSFRVKIEHAGPIKEVVSEFLSLRGGEKKEEKNAV